MSDAEKQIDANAPDEKGEGVSAVAVLETPELGSASTRTRETWDRAKKRWYQEGRLEEAELFKDQVRRQCLLDGKTRKVSRVESWDAAIAEFPPLDLPEPEPTPEPPKPEPPSLGLGSIPEEWPPLADNASLQAELSWVQSQRLRVVDGDRIHLHRASTPAPSMSALSWLETSVRSYAKYVDIVARCLAVQADETEAIHRERIAISEIRSLLAEMRAPKE